MPSVASKDQNIIYILLKTIPISSNVFVILNNLKRKKKEKRNVVNQNM